MKSYLELMKKIVDEGEVRPSRPGVDTYSLFGEQLRFDLTEDFPILTTKRVWFKGVVAELLWMISGNTNVQALNNLGVHIWDDWADEDGELGPVYGHQWRFWRAEDGNRVDQLQGAIDAIKENPHDRRIIVSAWNVGQLDAMRLPPCHLLFQFYAHTDGYLSCHMYQRSADYFIGVPFNIAQYALLTHMVAQVTGRRPGELIISFGDVHIYANHLSQVRELLRRAPRERPTLAINENVDCIDGFTLSDFKLVGYNPHPTIKADIAV